MVQVVQVIGILFALFAMFNVYLSYKHNTIKTYSFLFWSLVWLVTLVVAAYPQILRLISDVFQIGRSIDTLIYTSIVVLFYLIFKVFVKINTIEKETTKLVRLLALQEKKEKKL